MLEINDLSLRLGQKQILSHISFFLRPHRLTALVGRNGSGKSTLLNCINQQLPYSGSIVLDGKDLSRIAPRQRAKSIAFLPQSLPTPHITAREMVAFGRNPYLDFTGRLGLADQAAVEAALGEADALSLAERYVDTLSGGEKQRISLAMILAQNTPIALLDEPTAHMDLGYEGAFLETLQRLKNEKQKTFLVILHDLTQAVRYADDIILLDAGNLIFAGRTAECLDREIIEATFGLKRYDIREENEERIFFATR